MPVTSEINQWRLQTVLLTGRQQVTSFLPSILFVEDTWITSALFIEEDKKYMYLTYLRQKVMIWVPITASSTASYHETMIYSTSQQMWKP